jgi:Arc/MetJ-type ribon-helix-helix transcriptional regulator
MPPSKKQITVLVDHEYADLIAYIRLKRFKSAAEAVRDALRQAGAIGVNRESMRLHLGGDISRSSTRMNIEFPNDILLALAHRLKE